MLSYFWRYEILSGCLRFLFAPPPRTRVLDPCHFIWILIQIFILYNPDRKTEYVLTKLIVTENTVSYLSDFITLKFPKFFCIQIHFFIFIPIQETPRYLSGSLPSTILLFYTHSSPHLLVTQMCILDWRWERRAAAAEDFLCLRRKY